MKKLIILLLLVEATAAAQIKVNPRIALDVFTTPYLLKVQGADLNYNIVDYGTFRARIGAEASYRRFAIGFTQHVYMRHWNSFTFRPMQAEWFVNASFRLTDKLKLSVEHLCVHPVRTDGVRNVEVFGGYNMVSVSYGY
jgi:hypothetical protein